MPATHAVRRARLVSSNRNSRYTDTVATANQVPKNQVIYTVVTLSPEMVTIIRVYDRRKACHLVQIRQALHRYESLAREARPNYRERKGRTSTSSFGSPFSARLLHRARAGSTFAARSRTSPSSPSLPAKTF